MWIGNLMLVVLNLPLIGLWVKLLTVPYRLLFPAIMVFMAIGVYSVNNNPLDIHLALLFGVLGYIFIKLKCEPAPLILAVVLGPLMEENFRRAMLISRGDASVLVTRPISAGFLVATLLLLAVMIVPGAAANRVTTPLSSPKSYPADSAMCTIARVSLGKHEPPQPGPGLRNSWPMRLS